MSATVGAGDGAATELVGVGVLTSTGGSGLRAAAISSNRGLTKRKNTPAKAPPLNKRKRRMPPIISGAFDFFFSTGGGNGADGAWTGDAACVAGVVAGDCAAGGGSGATVTGNGGGGGVGGGVAGGGFAISEVVGLAPVGPVVGPVGRGSATVAG